MNCVFLNLDRGSPCVNCDYRLAHNYQKAPGRWCDADPSKAEWRAGRQPTKGLGDRFAEFLTSLGITEERYVAVKTKLHLDPNCNCAGRRAWMNKVGEEFGIDKMANKFGNWLKGGP